MLIREFRHADRDYCATIYQLAWREIFPGTERVISAQQLEDDTQGEQIVVAEKCREVVGFASLWKPKSFLHHLHVHPSHHRQGIGSALLRHVLQLAESDVSLKCQIDNGRALQFYRHHGFEETGERGSDSLGEWTRMILRSDRS
jgi:ribosomal protein S18 acetylase RimI-like enzyme